MDEYLTIDQVAQLTGLTRGHLAQLRYIGAGPNYSRPTPRTIRYRQSDVVAWLDNALTYPTSTAKSA